MTERGERKGRKGGAREGRKGGGREGRKGGRKRKLSIALAEQQHSLRDKKEVII